MNITITRTLSLEESDALTALVATRNAQLPAGTTPYTPESHLNEVIGGHIEGVVANAFDTSVRRLVAAAKAVPYEQRLAVIAAVEKQLS